MKIGLYVIFNICLSVFAILNETQKIKGLKYYIIEVPSFDSIDDNFSQKIENEPDLKLS